MKNYFLTMMGIHFVNKNNVYNLNFSHLKLKHFKQVYVHSVIKVKLTLKHTKKNNLIVTS